MAEDNIQQQNPEESKNDIHGNYRPNQVETSVTSIPSY